MWIRTSDWLRLNKRMDEFSKCLLDVKRDMEKLKTEVCYTKWLLGFILAAVVTNIIVVLRG